MYFIVYLDVCHLYPCWVNGASSDRGHVCLGTELFPSSHVPPPSSVLYCRSLWFWWWYLTEVQMAHKITCRNMCFLSFFFFFSYMYNIHVLFALLPKHGANSSSVIAAGLLHLLGLSPLCLCRGTFGGWWPWHACLDIGPPHVNVPPIPIVSQGAILRYRGASYFV